MNRRWVDTLRGRWAVSDRFRVFDSSHGRCSGGRSTDALTAYLYLVVVGLVTSSSVRADGEGVPPPREGTSESVETESPKNVSPKNVSPENVSPETDAPETGSPDADARARPSGSRTSPGDPDRIEIANGAVILGSVVETGGSFVRVEIGGGSREILKRDIVAVAFNSARQSEATLDADRVEFKNGHSVDGEAELIDGGRRVRIRVPLKAGADGAPRSMTVMHPMTDIKRVRWKNEAALNADGDYYTAQLERQIAESLEELSSNHPKKVDDARRFLSRAGIFAISAIEERYRSLVDASTAPGETEESPEMRSLRMLLHRYSLQRVVPRVLEERFVDVYEVLSHEGEPEARRERKASFLLAVVPNYTEECSELVSFLVKDTFEDESTRGLLIDLLRRLQRNEDLLNLYNGSRGQIQFAAAVALARNRILFGLPTLIDALSLESEPLRELADATLRESTGQDFGFRADGLAPARKAAIERWTEWWKANQAELEKTALLVLRSGRGESPEWKRATELWKLAHAAWNESHAEGAAREERIDSAISLLEEAIEADPTYVKAQISLAVILYVEKQRFREAQDILEGLVQRPLLSTTPGDQYTIWLELGHLARAQGRFEDALENYEESLTLRPDSLAAVVGQAEAQWLLATGRGDRDRAARRALLFDAIDGYRKGMELAVTALEGLVVLGADQVPQYDDLPFARRLHNRDVYDLRKGYERQTIELYEKVARAHAVLGDHEAAVKELRGGIEYLKLSLGAEEFSPEEAGLRNLLALEFERLGRHLDAHDEYSRVLKSLDQENRVAAEGVLRLKRRASQTGK